MKGHILSSVWNKAGFYNIISFADPTIEDPSQVPQPQVSTLSTGY